MDRFKGTDSYILSDALKEIVNAAIVLQRPLLLKGEPGTGKTELAQVIAEDLGLAPDPVEHQIHFQGKRRACMSTIRCSG